MKNLTRRLVPRQRVVSDDTLGRGVEIAVSVLIFTVVGLVVDARVGSTPWVAIGLFLFSSAGSFVRLYYTYTARMRIHERERRNGALR